MGGRPVASNVHQLRVRLQQQQLQQWLTAQGEGCVEVRSGGVVLCSWHSEKHDCGIDGLEMVIHGKTVTTFQIQLTYTTH